MSDDEDKSFSTKLKRFFLPMLHTPGTIKDWYSHDQENKYEEKDDIWSEFHLFHDEWIEIKNKKEWYDSPHVPQVYTDHKKIVKRNMDMDRPEEYFYYENMGNSDFESQMWVEDGELPSGIGKFRLDIDIDTQNPPSGENDACLVEYFVRGEVKYDVPGGIKFLPRFLAYPLNRFFKWAYIEFVAEEQIEYDGEYAQERVNEYFQYIRKYHGEEPIQTKSRQAVFKPSVEDGVFFQ